MEQKFSLAYLTIPGTHPVDQVEIAAKAGYDAVSLRPISQQLPGEPDFRFENQRLFADLKAALRDTGLGLNDIELARVAEGIDPSIYERPFALAAELGCEYVLSSVWTGNRDFYLPNFEKVCDLAAKFGLKVNLEFVPFAGVNTLELALELLDQAARPNARLLVDTLHAHRCGVTPQRLEAIPRERFGFIHLCDGPAWVPPVDHPDMIGVARAARLYVGEGGIDVAGMLKAMPRNVYSIELPNAAEVEARGKLGHAKRCLETAKEFFAENGIA